MLESSRRGGQQSGSWKVEARFGSPDACKTPTTWNQTNNWLAVFAFLFSGNEPSQLNGSCTVHSNLDIAETSKKQIYLIVLYIIPSVNVQIFGYSRNHQEVNRADSTAHSLSVDVQIPGGNGKACTRKVVLGLAAKQLVRLVQELVSPKFSVWVMIGVHLLYSCN